MKTSKNTWWKLALLATLAMAMTPAEAFAGGGSSWSGTTQLIGMVVNFLILMGLVSAFGMKKLRASLEARKEALEHEMREAARLNDEAEARLNDIEQRLGQLDAERQRILDEYRSLAESERRHIIEDAETQAERIRRDAKQAAQLEMDQARRSVRNEVLKLALTRAEVDLQEQVNAAKQQQLVDRYIDSLASMVVSDAQAAKN